jgi:hypothetical protein
MRPTASAVIATTALVVALGGSAYAATKINGRHIVKHSIAGNRLKGNALTGAQIEESRLKKVPAAQTARTAKSVNGNHVQTFAFTVTNNSAFHTVNIPGGAITGDCGNGAVNLDLTGAFDTGESYVVEGRDVTDGGFSHGDDLLTTTDFDALSPDGPPAPTSGAGLAVITRESSGVTTIDFSYRANSDSSCTYNGSVVASG